MSHSITALVMAAGVARRFGRDKRWVVLHSGSTMIEQVVKNIAAAQLVVRVVLRSDDERRDIFIETTPPLLIPAAAAERGLGASIAAAARLIADNQALLMCLADMPFIQPNSYRAIADAVQKQYIAVPTHNGQRGHPVGFAARYLPDLRRLDGEQGARDLLMRHSESVREIALDDAGVHRDIDTVADLLRYTNNVAQSQS
jgi:molybdenum cofactor cytidylyltransferase